MKRCRKHLEEDDPWHQIGILDIYGFERLEHAWTATMALLSRAIWGASFSQDCLGETAWLMIGWLYEQFLTVFICLHGTLKANRATGNSLEQLCINCCKVAPRSCLLPLGQWALAAILCEDPFLELVRNTRRVKDELLSTASLWHLMDRHQHWNQIWSCHSSDSQFFFGRKFWTFVPARHGSGTYWRLKKNYTNKRGCHGLSSRCQSWSQQRSRTWSSRGNMSNFRFLQIKPI